MVSVQGTGSLYFVEGIKEYQYKNMLEQRLIKQFQNWFPNEDFIFITINKETGD